jgi:hypothetical protein
MEFRRQFRCERIVTAFDSGIYLVRVAGAHSLKFLAPRILVIVFEHRAPPVSLSVSPDEMTVALPWGNIQVKRSRRRKSPLMKGIAVISAADRDAATSPLNLY